MLADNWSCRERKPKILTAWDNIQKALDQDLVIEGMVKRRTKGGLIVDIFGVEAFLPGSQIDVKPIRDFDVFVGKKMESESSENQLQRTIT